MENLCRKFTPVLIVLVTMFLVGGNLFIETADARSKMGGKSFKSSSKSYSQKSTTSQQAPAQKKGSFAKGLAGGLLGGALAGMLFGSMFGGEGFGLLPILLLAGAAFFLYRKFANAKKPGYSHQGHGGFPGQSGGQGQTQAGPMGTPPPAPGSMMAVEAGLAEIRNTDPGFDVNYFKEIASDVFFQVQAGWMRRDIDSYRHLLGDQLAGEYEQHFNEMREKGVINKLESIAIRQVEICDAGCTGTEDFVTVLFTANLLDYTVDEKSGDLVEGSMTEPVKFAEKWTWSRPIRTENWKLEGIKLADD